jgi:hypothetical protein
MALWCFFRFNFGQNKSPKIAGLVRVDLFLVSTEAKERSHHLALKWSFHQICSDTLKHWRTLYDALNAPR